MQRIVTMSSRTVGSGTGAGNGGTTGAGVYREAGIVEKLLASYGFIQCCERQARLFFHYSQYSGKVEHLKLGDPVEFEMTLDRKTSKPIATNVVKISSGAMFDEHLSQERVSGFITLEVTPDKEGRVAYENRGECFFLPFSQDDVEGDVRLEAKDLVTFHIATDKCGNLRAKCLRLGSPPVAAPYHGIVSTLKDRFGFIKRADCVKETFFHSSGCNNKIFNELSPNDCVEFDIEIRNGKEVAVNVNRLPSGSIIIEEIATEVRRGTITKTIDKSLNLNSNNNIGNVASNLLSFQQNMNTPFSFSTLINQGQQQQLQMQQMMMLQQQQQQQQQEIQQQVINYSGRISYVNDAGVNVEIPFGERDLKGEYTLHVSDIVEFQIATDRRDSSQHATNIKLHPSTFDTPMERREQGYVTTINDSFGFIKSLARDGTRVYFRMNELIEPDIPLRPNDEVEFTAISDTPSNRMQAIRIKNLPHGTVFKSLVYSNRKNSSSSNMSNSTASLMGGSGIGNSCGTPFATTFNNLAAAANLLASSSVNNNDVNNSAGDNHLTFAQTIDMLQQQQQHHHFATSTSQQQPQTQNHLANQFSLNLNTNNNNSSNQFNHDSSTNGFGSLTQTNNVGITTDNDYPLIDLNTDSNLMSNNSNSTFGSARSAGVHERFCNGGGLTGASYHGSTNQFDKYSHPNNGYMNSNGKHQFRSGIKSDSWSEILPQLPLNLNPSNDLLMGFGSSNASIIGTGNAVAGVYRSDKMAKLKANQDEQKGPRLVLIRQPRGPEPGKGFSRSTNNEIDK